jgi:RNA recognition motif-containing protein
MMSLQSARSKSVNAPSLPQTVILRNLPNNCSKSKLLDTVCEAGFLGTFDDFHMPLDQDTGANKGYAFFNFKTSSTAQVFKSDFHGKRLPGFNSRKVLVVELARLQSSAQEQFLPFSNKADEPLAGRSFIPAKILLNTLSSIPSCLDNFERQRQHLLASDPVKVGVSKVASEQPVFDSSPLFYFKEEHDDEGRTPSISDADSASDNEMKPHDKMQMHYGLPFHMYTIRL